MPRRHANGEFSRLGVFSIAKRWVDRRDGKSDEEWDHWYDDGVRWLCSGESREVTTYCLISLLSSSDPVPDLYDTRIGYICPQSKSWHV